MPHGLAYKPEIIKDHTYLVYQYGIRFRVIAGSEINAMAFWGYNVDHPSYNPMTAMRIEVLDVVEEVS